MRAKFVLLNAMVCGVVLLTSCGRAPAGRGAGETSDTSDRSTSFRVETVVANLEVPWAIVFTPDGRMLFTERPGRVRVFENGRLRPEPLAVIADVETRSEIGLMGMTIHPQYEQNRQVYLAYGYSQDGIKVRVVRFRDTGTSLVDRRVIIENIPGAPFHAGTRVGFGPDGKLYITTGDSAERALAQRLDSLAGKTLRLNDDGTVPSDNPFVQQSGARPEIWTIGHRNAQGMDWQPGTGVMVQTEHGPSGFDGPGGGDEVNIVERGKNYGWPLVHHRETRAGTEPPLLEYTPAVAPASAMFYRDTSRRGFPDFVGNFFFGNLRGECIIRVAIDGRRVVKEERILEKQYGRIREVVEGPDGALYFSTSNRDGRGSPAADDDRIIRLVPQNPRPN